MKWLRNPKVQFWIVLLFPVIAVLIAYAPIYNGPFIWDDEGFLLKWDVLHDPSKYGEILAGALPSGHEGGYRPLRTLYQAISWQVFRDHPFPYHLQAVIFHVVGTILVFHIIRKLLILFTLHKKTEILPPIFEGKKKKKKYQLFNRQLSQMNVVSDSENNADIWLASLGAVIFGLHPIMQASVAFIQANFDAMGITYALVAIAFFLASFQSKNIHISIIHISFSALFSFIAFAFFELVYPLPFILFITAYLFFLQNQKLYQSFFRSIVFSLPSFFALGIIFFFRFVVFDLGAGRPSSSPGSLFTFLATTRAIFQYIFQTIFPIHLAAIHEIAPGITTLGADALLYTRLRITDFQTIVAIVVVISLLILGLVMQKKNPLLTLGIVWYFAGILPVLNILVQGTVYSERYLYFSIAGFACIGVGLCVQLSRYFKKTTYFALIIIFLMVSGGGLYGLRTFFRVKDWTNPIEFWKKEVRNVPMIAQVKTFLGNTYASEGRDEEALAIYSQALKQDPFDGFIFTSIALVYLRKEDYQKAREYAEQAVVLRTDIPTLFTVLQGIYAKIPDSEHEMQFYGSLISTGKGSAGIYYLHGMKALRLGQTATAEASLRKTLELNPDSLEAYANLGALLNYQHRPTEARDVLEKGRQKGIKNLDLLYSLATSYAMLGQLEKAKSIIDEAHQINPTNTSINSLRDKLEASISATKLKR